MLPPWQTGMSGLVFCGNFRNSRISPQSKKEAICFFTVLAGWMILRHSTVILQIERWISIGTRMWNSACNAWSVASRQTRRPGRNKENQ